MNEELKAIRQSQIVDRRVTQHNYLINTPFKLGIIENRLFTLMLTTIYKGDEDFKETFIPVNHIISYKAGTAAYKSIQDACKKLHSLTLSLKSIENPDVLLDDVHVFRRMKLIKGKGVYGWFDPMIKDYLLDLKGNFTTAQIEELLSLKSAHSHKMYWLLHSYKDIFDNYGRQPEELLVDDLRNMLLEDTSKYKMYGEFKKFILKPACEELKGTELAFEYEELKTGKAITRIQFLFKKQVKATSKSSGKLSSNDTATANNTIDQEEATPSVGHKNDPELSKRAYESMVKYGLSKQQADLFISKISDHRVITKGVHELQVKYGTGLKASHLYTYLDKVVNPSRYIPKETL